MCQWSIVVSALTLLVEPMLDEFETKVFRTFLVTVLLTVHIVVIVMAIMPNLLGNILWYYRYYTADVSAKVTIGGDVGTIEQEANESMRLKLQKKTTTLRAALRTAQEESASENANFRAVLTAKDSKISELEQLIAQMQQSSNGRSQTGQLQDNELNYSMDAYQAEQDDDAFSPGLPMDRHEVELNYSMEAYQTEQEDHAFSPGRHSEAYTHATQAAQRSRTFRSAESALRAAAEPGNANAGGKPVARASAGEVGMALSPKTKSWSQALRRMVTDVDE